MKRKFRLRLIVFFLSVFVAAYLSHIQKSSSLIFDDSRRPFFGEVSADPTVYYPSGYGLLGLTTYSSGNFVDLQSDNNAYMIFSSYQTQTSNQTLYAHRDTTTIGGTTYYLSKLTSSDSTGISRSISVSSTGRKLFGKFVYNLSGVSSLSASSWTVYYRTWVSGSGSTCHDDVDIIIRQSNGTVRTTIATNVATSASLTTTQQTLSGTYSFSTYIVVNQTDYLEIDYYVHVTTSASRTAYLRIDDNTLGTAQQTRAANVYLPSEYTSEVEFLGSSDANAWTQLVWAVDSSWTRANVSVTMQLYNYTLGGYPADGNGYLNYTSSSTANMDETKNQTISINPLQFRDGSGNWRIKIKGVAFTTTQFAFKADLINLAFLDTAPPLWSNADTNNNVAGQPALFYVKWNDNVGLSGYIFASNNTGVWANDTWVQMGGLTNWSNVTKTLNSTSNLLQWRVWTNDTSDNWSDTEILSSKVLRTPISSYTFSPSTPCTSDTVTFNASASTDPDGTIVSYYWTFGDGTNTTGIVTTHAYANNGAYPVLLTVTDNDTLTNTTAKNVTVLDRAPVASFTNSLSSAPTGTAISFNASSSYDPDGTITSYYWTFGDGTNSTGIAVSHSYADNGTYTVTLTVTDDDGSTGVATTVETISNRPPIASFTASADNVLTNVIIYFNASASYDPDGTIASYYWSFGDGTNATGMNVQHAYAENGTYLVTLTVADNDLSTASANTTRTILNRPPVASFTKSATSVYTGVAITFNASASYDPDGSVVSHFWIFGDGTNSTGVITSHAYVDNGTCTVTLTVTDNDGTQANSTSAVTILNRPPVASFIASATNVHKNDIVHFNASASYDPDGTIVSCSWSFGDGTNGTGITVDHSYANAGNYTVGLNVTDNDGSIASTSTVITVLNQPPIANFTTSATTVYTGDAVSFNASASYDPDGTIVSCLWTFGDGFNASGVIAAHSYLDNGTYVVTLKVTDNDGAPATATTTVSVLNRPPIASFTQSPATVFTGDVTTFNASASYDPDGSIVSYFWSFGDGSNGTGLSVTHAYAENDTYSVTLTVTDNDGLTASSISTGTVLNRPPVASFTKSATSVYTGVAITFNASASYDPDGSITGYFWSFGDGTNGTGVIVSHAYVDNGTYAVALTVTDNDGTQASSSSAVTILNRSPVASFASSATNVNKNDVIHFNASASYDPDGLIVSCFWTFGDGANGTGITIDHSYANAGNYTVTMNVTDNDGALASTFTMITVINQLPIANFSASAATVNTGVVVSFNASGSYDLDGLIVSYLWAFGDGTNATGVTTTHSYADNGAFVVTLKVTDNDGATVTTTTAVTVLNRPPVASFTQSPATVFTGDMATFNASTSYDPDGTLVSYLWSFGDGSNATGVIVTHAYVENGTYSITLIVTDNDGLTASSVSTGTVLNRPPVASFTKSATSVYTGVAITFNASASYDPDGSVVSHFWIFGDGTNSTGVITSHAYVDNGTCTVTLTVTDNDGTQASSSSAVTILNRPPAASFTTSATNVYKNDTVHFNASASYDPDGTITSYFWTFGDGANATGTTVDHSYPNAGTYTVSLTVTDNDGSVASSYTSINIENQPPIADFTASPPTVNTGVVVNFDGSTSYDPDGVIVGYLWTFGDGFNTSGVTPAHSYVDNGTYVVTLKITDNDGATASTTTIITVLNRPPVASFTETADTVLTGDTIYFNASASNDPDGFITTYSWSFGDGANATGLTANHAYADNGTYTVTLTVTDNDGASSSSHSTETVLNRPPVASFTKSATPIFTGVVISFNASGSYDADGVIVGYFWTFGDGTNASGVTSAHSYTDNGTFVVALRVTDNDGATATSTAAVTVLNRPPIASFTQSSSTVSTGDTVNFNASASYDPDGLIASYFWSFGDGTNSIGMTANHSYTENGSYTVILTVTDNDGSTGTSNATETVLNRPPVTSFTQSANPVYTYTYVYFDGSGSYDPDGTIISYFWTFGDGSNATGTAVSHTYLENANYTVVLSVTDNDGSKASSSFVETVLNRPPIASFTVTPYSPITGFTVTFDSSSSHDQDGTIVSYTWNFGDGNITTTSNQVITHTYTTFGSCNVTLTVTDNDAAVSSTSNMITVRAYPIAAFTLTPIPQHKNQVITFNASISDPRGGIVTSYLWTFGDGSQLNTTNPVVTHTYGTTGNYTATLTVTDSENLNNTVSKEVSVLEGYPIAIFTYTPAFPAANQTIPFDASDSFDPNGYVVSYVWNFGDGNVTSIADPHITHKYTSVGNYTARLTVTDNDGLTNTASKVVTVGIPPTANFTYVPTTPFVGDTVTFNASASMPGNRTITSYLWDFGDGSPIDNETVQTTTHVYKKAGNFTATLTILCSDGLASTTSKPIVIMKAPVALFTIYPTSPEAYDTITLDASGSYDPNGYVVSYIWDFGDGNVTTATTPIITHSYTTHGNYSIVLVVSDNSGYADSTTKILTVTPHPPSADFSHTPDFPKAGESVSFNASQSYDIDGSIVSYSWNFGDGNSTATSSPIITHTYASYGNYTARLTVIDQDSLSDSKTYTVRIRDYPAASFTITPDIPALNETVTFDASSSSPKGGAIVWYVWDFGDGSQVNVTGPTTTHSYTALGNFTVALTVSDSEGLSNTISKTIHISQRPEASFTYAPLSPHTGEIVTFNASMSKPNSGILTGYTWIFGDGNTTSTGNPTITHIYGTSGNYTVTLTVQNSEGLTGSTTKNVTVQNLPPNAIFTFYPTTQATNRPIAFNASGSYDPDGSITNYTWTFGDGNITVTSAATITHVYSTIGNYTATLQVKDNQGLSNSTSKTVQICFAPLANFTYSPAGPSEHQLVTFNASGSYDPDGYITSYNWDFGDGITGNTTNPMANHTYLSGGDYQVRLAVFDNKGLDAAYETALHVKGVPFVQFTWTPSYPIVGDSVTFNASSSTPNGGTIVTYAWNFGDGIQLNTTNPLTSHVYGTLGNYTVTLTIVNSDQLSNSLSNVTRIRNYPIASFVYAPNPIIRRSPAVFDASASDPRGGMIQNYTWNFGDGNVTVTSNPVAQHAFDNAGMYQVKLTVYDSEGLTGLLSKTAVVVQASPLAMFIHTPDNPLVGQQTIFNSSGSYDPDGYIANYTWNFGDGAVVSGLNPVVYHVFNAKGTYQVNLSVFDNDGYNSSTLQAVEVIAYPYATFSWSPYPYAIILAPTIFNASSSSAGSGTITTYVWNFSDGNISITSNPVISHIFNASGQYNVALTITNSYNLSSSNTKTVSLYGTPFADFTWTPAVPQANSTVAFDASLSKSNGVIITTYTWNFGDGSPTVPTTSPTTAHTYLFAQTYNVTLSVKNNAGLTGNASKQLTVFSWPQADFMWTPSSPFAYDVISFDASSSSPKGSITRYSWSFGDGNTTTILNPMITHSYSTANSYMVTLNITDNNGLSNTTSKTLNLVPSQSPLVDFTFSPLLPGVHEQVVFDASGTVARGGTIVAYSWNLGNGTTINVADPVMLQTYQTAGNFTVTLNTTNTAGYWSIMSKLVQVIPIGSPKANFTMSPTAPSCNQTLTFDASDSVLGWNGTMHPSIVLYTWSFGDGNTTSTTAPVVYHAYSQNGNCTVTLTVTDADGRTDSLARTITISSVVGDLNGDGKVDMRDVAIVAKAFSTIPGDPNWNPIADLNGDGRVDMKDIAIVVKAFNPT